MGVSSALGVSALFPAGFGFRNVLINGDMQVAQRGTSTAGITTAGYYTADRFHLSIGSFGTWTQSVENDAPTGSGFRKSLKMLCTTAAASPAVSANLTPQYRLEGQNLQQFLKGTTLAKQFAVSFWVKSNVTGTYILELDDQDNSRSVSVAYTINASGTWEKKILILPADTTGAFDNDNAYSLGVNFWLGAGTNFTSGSLATTWGARTTANRVVGQANVAAATNNYWQITGVQLEANVQPTPFEHRPIGVELALCQRYYNTFNVTNGTMGPNTVYNTGGFWFPYAVEMRATPSVSISGQAMKVGDAGATSISIGPGTYGDVDAARGEIGGGAWVKFFSGTLTANAEL